MQERISPPTCYLHAYQPHPYCMLCMHMCAYLQLQAYVVFTSRKPNSPSKFNKKYSAIKRTVYVGAEISHIIPNYDFYNFIDNPRNCNFFHHHFADASLAVMKLCNDVCEGEQWGYSVIHPTCTSLGSIFSRSFNKIQPPLDVNLFRHIISLITAMINHEINLMF